MHPLYNRHGPRGKPILSRSPFQDEGIVWVHTLCALALNINIGTNGLIFGCNADGSYDSDGDGDEEEITSSEETSHDDKEASVLNLTFSDKKGFELLHPAPNHFVLNYHDDVASTRIKEFRELRCQFCKKNDTMKGVLRIPMQVRIFFFITCVFIQKWLVNDLKLLIKCSHEDCSIGLHVGCARWAEDESHFEFFSEVGDEATGKILKESRARGFCKKHFKIFKAKGIRYTTDYKLLERYGYEINPQNEEGTSFDSENNALHSNGNGNGNHEDTVNPAPKRPRAGDSNSLTATKKRSKTCGDSEYQKKKKEIDENSGLILNDIKIAYTECFDRGDSWQTAEKKKKRRLAHWKEILTKGTYKKCMSELENDLAEIEIKFKQKKVSTSKERKKKVARKRTTKNRWSNLFLPDHVPGLQGSVFPLEWDSYEEVSESELQSKTK